HRAADPCRDRRARGGARESGGATMAARGAAEGEPSEQNPNETGGNSGTRRAVADCEAREASEPSYATRIFELTSPGGGAFALSGQPAAGAQGELAGVLMIRAYHRANEERRTEVLIPHSAHGTNPASTAIAGYRVVQLKSEANGEVDLLDLERNLDAETAAFM